MQRVPIYTKKIVTYASFMCTTTTYLHVITKNEKNVRRGVNVYDFSSFFTFWNKHNDVYDDSSSHMTSVSLLKALCVFICLVCVWNIKKRRELKLRRFVRENLVYYVHTDEKICKSTSVKIKHTHTHKHSPTPNVHTHRSKWGWQVIYERHFPHTCMSLMYTLLVGTERREIGNLMNGVSTFVLMVYFLCRKASIGFFFCFFASKENVWHSGGGGSGGVGYQEVWEVKQGVRCVGNAFSYKIFSISYKERSYVWKVFSGSGSFRYEWFLFGEWDVVLWLG